MPVRVRNIHRPAERFEDYIEHIYELMRARNIKSARDPRVPVYLSMLMLEYPETLAPGRLRERVALKGLAVSGSSVAPQYNGLSQERSEDPLGGFERWPVPNLGERREGGAR